MDRHKAGPEGRLALWGPQGCFPLCRAGQGDAEGACLGWDTVSEPPPLSSAGVPSPLLQSLALRVSATLPRSFAPLLLRSSPEPRTD